MGVRDITVQTEAVMKKALDSVLHEFAEVRTGRAHPGLVEDLHVVYYGVSTPLKQMAAVSSPDASCLVIQPWDPSALADIEKAILGSKLGITPNNDGKVIRLVVPHLSEDRRKEMAKIAREIAEKGRVTLRTIRRESNEKIIKLKKDSVIAEDDSFKGQEEVQKLTDRYTKEVDLLLDKKTKDLLTI